MPLLRALMGGPGRRVSQVDDLRAAGAGEPDIPAIPPTIQISAALVLSDKGHQSGEGAWHGAGRISQR